MKPAILTAVLAMLLYSCKHDKTQYYLENNPYKTYSSYKEFKTTINELSEIKNSNIRDSLIAIVLDSLKCNDQIPFKIDTMVMFIYHGEATNISFTGDFDNWTGNNKKYRAQKLNKSNLWIVEQTFPDNARFDYQIVVNTPDNKITDNMNPHKHNSPNGIVSELRMPNYIAAKYTNPQDNIDKGSLSETKTISRQETNLDYDINYQVYTPYNYAYTEQLPVIYYINGEDFINPLKGNTITILDNLVANKIIPPIIAVFVSSPTSNNSNENHTESRNYNDLRYLDFLTDQLVKTIDKEYKTLATPDNRAIAGVQHGARLSIIIGIKQSKIFGLIAAQSPIIEHNLIREYGKEKKLQLKIFLSSSNFSNEKENTMLLRNVLIYKGYNIESKETYETETWNTWKNQTEQILSFFFKKH